MSTKTLKMLFVVLFCIFTINVLEAQTPRWKTLKTESDGFQWYEYTYEENSNCHYPHAAFDLNGNRITPTNCRIEYKNGYFFVGDYSNESDNTICDRQGKNIMSNIYYFFPYDCLNFDFFIVELREDIYGNRIQALYDNQWNCIISDSYGFTLVCPTVEDGSPVIVAFRKDKDDKTIDGTEFVFSLDGKYYITGTSLYLKMTEFNAKKKPVSKLNPSYIASLTSKSSSGKLASSNSSSSSTTKTSSSSSSASTASGSSSSSSNTTSGSKKDEGLLYQGDYTEGTLVGQRTGWTMASGFPQHFGIRIYEDHLEDMGTWKYEGKSMNGCRVYSMTQGWGSSAQTVKYYVDGNFDITAERVVCPGNGPCETYISQFSKGNVAFNINNAGGQGNGGWNGGNSNTGGNEGKNGGYTQPKGQKMKDCPICFGSGKCKNCNGNKVRLVLGEYVNCTNCNATGKCPYCHGTGKVVTH